MRLIADLTLQNKRLVYLKTYQQKGSNMKHRKGKKGWTKIPQNISELKDNFMQFAEKGQRCTRKLQMPITQEHRCKT